MSRNTKSEDINIVNFVENLLSPRYFGQKYSSSTSKDELMIALGESTCLTACKLTTCFKLSRRGRIFIRLAQVLSPNSYYRFWNTHNKVFCNYLSFILSKLQIYLQEELPISVAEEICVDIAGLAAAYLKVMTKMTKEEGELLISELEQTMKECFYNETPNDKNDERERIFRGLGRKPKPNEIVMFIKETVEKDPLAIMEPHIFIEKWKKLHCLR